MKSLFVEKKFILFRFSIGHTVISNNAKGLNINVHYL